MVAPTEKHLPGAMSYPEITHPVLVTVPAVCWCLKYIAVLALRHVNKEKPFVVTMKCHACSLVLACRYLLVVGWFYMSCACPQSILAFQTFVQTAARSPVTCSCCLYVQGQLWLKVKPVHRRYCSSLIARVLTGSERTQLDLQQAQPTDNPRGAC